MNHDIFLRCHTRILKENPRRYGSTRRAQTLPQYVLVLDTETTTDARQNLNFGVYQFCELDSDSNYECLEEGLFYADNLDTKQRQTLHRYVEVENLRNIRKHARRLRMYDRSAFLEQVMYVAIQAGAAIVAFNLPFDLSRLAVEYRIARVAGGRGWSLVLFRYRNEKANKWLPNTFRPRIQLRPKDSKAAFMRLAGGDQHQPYRRGRFLDLKTLAWALRNRSFSLESACREFKVPGKLDQYAPSGRVTRDEIDYCRQDVQASVGLLNALLTEFKKYPLGDLPPEKAYSAASIAKAFLGTMGVIPPAQKFGLADEMSGICMQAYYGGRAEIRIRHTPVPVVYTDFTSQYPTVNTLLDLWRLLTAKKVRVRDATRDVKVLLRSVSVDRLLDPKTWPKLGFFALIQPNGDVLPVRAVYRHGANNETNIGLNPLTSDKALWLAGPDIVASALLTGRPPKIIRSIRFEAVGVQKGLNCVKLGEGSIDPYRDDFFRKVIEERKGKGKSDPLYYFLKILANAGCYGIYAEVNQHQTGKNRPKQIGIFSGDESRTERTCILEQPGPWYFPPVSALITAGGRLLLALLERMVTDAGGTHLMCDTDSMAIVASEHGGLVACKGGPHRTREGGAAVKALSWKEVRRIVDRFETLNPYDAAIVPGSMLNIVEEINYDPAGNQCQLFGYGISAKRYPLYKLDGSKLQIVKASEHGLGLYYRPREGRDKTCDVPVWIKEGWQWILCRALGLRCEDPDWFRVPVMRRIAISTPNVMAALRRLNRDQARPYNFAMSPVLVNLAGSPITLLGSFEKDSSRWETMVYVNIHDGTAHTLNPPSTLLLVQTFEMVFAQYIRHPESKSLAPDGTPCKAYTQGLLKRYPVWASGFHLIGKETERGWEQAEDISTLLPSLVHYQDRSGEVAKALRKILREMSLSTLQKRTGLSKHTILRARRGEKVRPSSLRRLRSAAGTVSVQEP